MKSLLILLSVCIPISANAQEHQHHEKQKEQKQEQVQHQHKEHLDILISEYLEVKNALVADDVEKAQKHMALFAKEVKGSGEMNQHEEHSEKHEMHHAAMLKATEAATTSKDIKAMRAAFKAVSAELIKAVENQGVDEKLFVQFCSMEKGYWLSKEEKVQNPFFGASMSGCGNVDRVIE
ncbi:MAG: DUF3347 domain-containing protein [Balneolaceae bacterium]